MSISNKIELKHLTLISNALIKVGFEVETPNPKFTDLLDVWGYVTPKESSRRKKCFHEIYCTIIIHDNGNVSSYWRVNYDNQSEFIEVCQKDNYIYNEFELISAVKSIIDPIKKMVA